jgi:hypothetical protein
MDLKKSTKNKDSKSKIKKKNHRPNQGTNLNQRLRTTYRKTRSHPEVTKEWIRYQWEQNFVPHWFITLEWNDLPTQYSQIEGHCRHFRNVFLTSLLNQRVKDLPEPPRRPHMVFFQERKPVINRGRQITAYHTHLHLGPLPDPLNHLWYLETLIHQKVSPRVQKLLKTTTEGNRGVVIKPWVWDHHAFYNLKDYYRYKHHQDPDLTLDYKNSDLKT